MAVSIGVTGWCDADAVERRVAQFKAAIGASSTPLDTDDIEAFILSRFRQMNAVLQKIGVTLTELDGDTTAEAVLKPINELGAAWDVLRALAAGVLGDVPPIIGEYKDEYEKELRRLGDDYYSLGAVETDRDDTTRLPSSMLSGGDYAEAHTKIDQEW